MATFANLTINDGKATPVAHTFSAKTCIGRTAIWEDRVTGIPIAYPKLSLTTKDSDVVRRVNMSLSLPVLKQINGVNDQGYTPAASVSHSYKGSIELLLPQIGTQAERNDFIAYMTNAFNQTLIKAVMKDGDEVVG